MAWPDQSKDSRNSASQFTRRVSIQALSTTPNGSGGKASPDWITIIDNTPAKIAHVTASKMGEEKFVSQQLYATQVIIVTIRYRASVNIVEGMRLLYRSKHYRIRAAYVPDESQKTIMMYAEEIQTAGTAR